MKSILDDYSNMTYYSHMRTINISTLKAHISAELRRVRAGERLIVLDRDIPVAEVVPYSLETRAVMIRPPKHRLVYPKSSFSVKTDPIQYLMEERSKR